MPLSAVQTLYECMFCLLFVCCLSSSTVSVVVIIITIIILIIVVIVCIFICFCNLQLWMKSKREDAQKLYFYIKSIRYQVKGPIENFQTRSLTVLYLV